MRIAKIEKDSLNNGPGVRAVIWCQGCSIRCPECHNKDTWDMFGGRNLTDEDLEDLYSYLSQDYVSGLTFSGGHPLECYNIDYVYCIAKEVRKRFPGKSIWLYTGLELDYDKIVSDVRLYEALIQCDVVVDGPYVAAERDITLSYRGSRNQRLIDVRRTMESKQIVLWKEQQ